MSSKRLSGEFAGLKTGLRENGLRSAAWVAIIVAAGCSLTGVISGVARGQDVEAVLKGKITDLEAENKALRLLLGEIQTVLGKTPPAVKSEIQGNAKFRLFVSPGDWGSSSLVDVKKVCESAGMAFAPHLGQAIAAPLLVENDGSGPITLYRRGENNEHIVRLNSVDRAWAQLAFQFSHELCHVMCNYRNVKNEQLWFEETLCECASLFALRRMAETWKTNAPYSNWKSYSSALNDYAMERLKEQGTRTDPLKEIYRANRPELEASGTNRKLNNTIAARLLPLFEKNPAAWESVRFINQGPVVENRTFERYLSGWHSRVPEQHKAFVVQVAEEFGVPFIR